MNALVGFVETEGPTGPAGIIVSREAIPPIPARYLFGARLRARRLFPPALHLPTRSFFLTLASRECQLFK
jgi:hypothetical protein